MRSCRRAEADMYDLPVVLGGVFIILGQPGPTLGHTSLVCMEYCGHDRDVRVQGCGLD